MIPVPPPVAVIGGGRDGDVVASSADDNERRMSSPPSPPQHHNKQWKKITTEMKRSRSLQDEDLDLDLDPMTNTNTKNCYHGRLQAPSTTPTATTTLTSSVVSPPLEKKTMITSQSDLQHHNHDQSHRISTSPITTPPIATSATNTAAAANANGHHPIIHNHPNPNHNHNHNLNHGYRGLRQFSMLVCKKVQEKGTTSYSEVADALVLEYMSLQQQQQQQEDASDTSSSTIENNIPKENINAEAAKPSTTKTSRQKQRGSRSDVVDEKNIRRRVYDALNVLMAMDIITKDINTKAIAWKGLPYDANPSLESDFNPNANKNNPNNTTTPNTSSSTSASASVQELQGLYIAREQAAAHVAHKRMQLQELLMQHVSYRNLIDRNYQQQQQEAHQQAQDQPKAQEATQANPTQQQRQRHHHPNQSADHQPSHPNPPSPSPHSSPSPKNKSNPPPPHSSSSSSSSTRPPNHVIPLPFIVVNTHASAVIQCNMSPDLSNVMFDFSLPFAIHDDQTILKRLNLHKTDRATLQSMIPPDLYQYSLDHGLLDAMLMTDPDPHQDPYHRHHHHPNSNYHHHNNSQEEGKKKEPSARQSHGQRPSVLARCNDGDASGFRAEEK